ncbi:heparinase, partial [Corallococcus exiguus]|uniref:heparinase II/III domain-containing protein n=1 Tax=Corallococcus exiguus TaxID=83462 RepID=UPI001475C4B2
DVGGPPPTALSAAATAGCLSFEFSSGVHRIVVNCGTPRIASEALAQAARSTAAHSTMAINELSSCQFVTDKGFWFERTIARWLLRRLGPVVLSGPTRVVAERTERERVQGLNASHDGYLKAFGVRHERRWQLAPDGHILEGEDIFWGESAV